MMLSYESGDELAVSWMGSGYQGYVANTLHGRYPFRYASRSGLMHLRQFSIVGEPICLGNAR